jgi:short-subunit dehydrogenase
VCVLGLHPGPTSTEFQRRSGSEHLPPPALLVQTADAVVEQGMAALHARKSPTIIAGTRVQKLLTFANRFRSRRAVVEQMGGMFRDPPAG